MKALALSLPAPHPRQPRWWRRSAIAALVALLGGTAFDAQQRKWIFQAGQRSDAQSIDASSPHDTWIEFDSQESGARVRLHGVWLAQARTDAPVLLYLHGARCHVGESVERMQRLHSLGFAVLGIDYRGFGRSSAALPSERMACEDAHAAWQWLATQHPQAQRYLYGHSLGGAIAVQLATGVDDVAGLIVEGTFTSLAAVFGSFRWGWLPLGALITQRFDSAARVPHLKAPLLVVHGSADRLIRPELGRALYERATAPKRFMLVEGGTHHDTDAIGHLQYREALRELFGLTV